MIILAVMTKSFEKFTNCLINSNLPMAVDQTHIIPSQMISVVCFVCFVCFLQVVIALYVKR